MNRGSILLSSRMPLGECEPTETVITQLKIPPLVHSGMCYWAKCCVRERGRRVASRNLLQSWFVNNSFWLHPIHAPIHRHSATDSVKTTLIPLYSWSKGRVTTLESAHPTLPLSWSRVRAHPLIIILIEVSSLAYSLQIRHQISEIGCSPFTKSFRKIQLESN